MTLSQGNQPLGGLVAFFFIHRSARNYVLKGNVKVNSFNLQSHFFSCYPLCLGSKNFSCSDTFIIIYIHIFDRRFNNIVTLNATKGQQSEKRCSLSLQFGKIHPTPATNQIPGFSEYPLLYYIKNELIHFINFGVYFVFNKK